MSNVMSLKSFQNNVKRNGFDLSFKNAFTAKAGELLPVMVKEVIPGDKFKINGQSFTRTQPLNSAAFVRMREYYDVFFVPYRLLWNRFPTFFTNMNDFHHAAGINQSGDVTDMHPYFTGEDIYEYIVKVKQADVEQRANFFGFDRNYLTEKLLHYLGYGKFEDPSVLRNEALNPMPLLAYQKIYQDFFRDDQWEQAAPYCYNLDYITQANAGSTLHIPVESISLDQLNMFDLRYCNWSKDYFMGMLPSSQYGDEAFVPLGGGSGSLSVSFDESKPILGAFNRFSEVSTPVEDNKLYWDLWAGNDSRNPFQESEWPSPSVPSGYVSSSLNNALLGNDSQKVVLPVSNPKYLNDSLIVSGGSSVSSRLSVLALRQSECLQKWKEIAQSGKQDYRTQMQKHFNVTPSEAMADHCRYLGGWTSNIDINEVVNSNFAVESTSLGQADIKGKGVGVGRGSVEFDAKEHGILMVMYHNMPLLDYSLHGVKRLNLKTHFTDYAIPEFDSVGMQQVNPAELGYGITFDADSSPMGYVPRYADYKTSYDEVHGAFAYEESGLIGWVAPLTDSWLSAYSQAVVEKYGSWKIVYEFFKVNPSILDNLFGLAVNSSINTDQFLVNAFFDVKAVRNIDYNGLPY